MIVIVNATTGIRYVVKYLLWPQGAGAAIAIVGSSSRVREFERERERDSVLSLLSDLVFVGFEDNLTMQFL